MTIEQFVAEIRERCAAYQNLPDFSLGDYASTALPRAAEIIEELLLMMNRYQNAAEMNWYRIDDMATAAATFRRSGKARLDALLIERKKLTGEQATTNREQEGALRSDVQDALQPKTVGPDASTGRSQPPEATLAHGERKEDHT